MVDFARHLLRLNGQPPQQPAAIAAISDQPAGPSGDGSSHVQAADRNGDNGIQDDKPRTASQLAEKRVANGLIKKELGVSLDFPTYREGLTAIHKRNLTPFMP